MSRAEQGEKRIVMTSCPSSLQEEGKCVRRPVGLMEARGSGCRTILIQIEVSGHLIVLRRELKITSQVFQNGATET